MWRATVATGMRSARLCKRSCGSGQARLSGHTGRALLAAPGPLLAAHVRAPGVRRTHAVHAGLLAGRLAG
jgi:hypothetical protein